MKTARLITIGANFKEMGIAQNSIQLKIWFMNKDLNSKVSNPKTHISETCKRETEGWS